MHRGGAGTSPPGTRCASGGATASSCGAPSSYGGPPYGGPPYGGPCSCGSSPTHARPKSSSRRFTYGLSEFDDETVERMLAVDHADKRRVAQQRVLVTLTQTLALTLTLTLTRTLTRTLTLTLTLALTLTLPLTRRAAPCAMRASVM